MSCFFFLLSIDNSRRIASRLEGKDSRDIWILARVHFDSSDEERHQKNCPQLPAKHSAWMKRNGMISTIILLKYRKACKGPDMLNDRPCLSNEDC
jgi:hypothetical protein